jgi:biotin synthase
MFEELGLNTARQADNGANPRPDNRSGWLDGETPSDTPIDRLVNRQDEAPFWDPSRQLRHRPKSSVPPRPDGAPNKFPEVLVIAGSDGSSDRRRAPGAAPANEEAA